MSLRAVLRLAPATVSRSEAWRAVALQPPRRRGRFCRVPSARGAMGLAAFLSGAAALLFETLWFRQASLAFGNSVWAASLVLAAFMAGLGLGSALAARRGRGLRHPARAYAALELLIGASRLALVLLLPRLAPLLAPLLRSLLDHPLALGAARFALSGLLLVLPATAMGATLPLLVKGSRGDHPRLLRTPRPLS